jgi:hypothetical protein
VFRKAALFVLASTIAFSAVAKPPITIDATTEASAQRSYERMTAALPKQRQIDLSMAVLKINMDGINSAAEMLADPELRNPGVARIRQRVAGMTAEQIIAEAEKVTSVQFSPPQR